MQRITILIPALLIPALLAAAAAAADTPVLDPARLAPAQDATEPAAVYAPEPGPAERWRTALADASARRDADLDRLQQELARAADHQRPDLERRLQLRKLDFEIEVLELQLALTLPRSAAADAADPALTAARARVTAAADAARALRGTLAARADLPAGEEQR